MNMEIWKDIEGYEGLYQVSNMGRVRRNSSVLKPGIKNGYYFVGLSKNSKRHDEYIHRLVAKAFIDNPNGYLVVNHKDERRLNNAVENLEWCTTAYNNAYGTRLMREVLTKSRPVYQMLDGVIVHKWASTKEAERAGYRSGCISLCCLGKRNTHKGYSWQYAT